MTLKAVTKLAILLVALAAMALPLTGTPVSAAQGNTQGKPTINGILRVGETLTADNTTFSDPDGIAGVTKYQWSRQISPNHASTVASEGRTATTHTLVEADLGKYIKVRVTFVDGIGYLEFATSSLVGPVLPAFDDRATLVALYDSAGGANWDDSHQLEHHRGPQHLARCHNGHRRTRHKAGHSAEQPGRADPR